MLGEHPLLILNAKGNKVMAWISSYGLSEHPILNPHQIILYVHNIDKRIVAESPSQKPPPEKENLDEL